MKSVRFLLVSCFAFLPTVASFAQEVAPAQTNTTQQLTAPNPDKWWFEIDPYLWMTALKTEADIGPVDAESDLDFGDILDHLQGALMLHAEAHKGHWGIFGDVMWAKIEAEDDIGPNNGGEIEVEVGQTFLELGGLYTFGSNKATFDVLFGARAAFINTDIEIIGAAGGDASRDGDTSWVEPMIGGRFRYAFTPKWFISTRADVSGFGLGSEITWNANAFVGYRFTKMFSMALGYRYMFIDYEDGDLDMKMTMQGPVLGFGFRF